MASMYYVLRELDFMNPDQKDTIVARLRMHLILYKLGLKAIPLEMR